MQILKVPKLLVLKGLPGTGKSTLAQELHGKLKWPLIVRDVIKEQLIREGVQPHELGLRSHQLMWKQAEDYLVKCVSCICDTNLNQPVVLDDLRKLESRINVNILIIECIADESVIRVRVEERKNKGLLPFWIDSWQKYKQYLSSKKNQGNFKAPFAKLEVDTSGQVDLNEISSWINAH